VRGLNFFLISSRYTQSDKSIVYNRALRSYKDKHTFPGAYHEVVSRGFRGLWVYNVGIAGEIALSSSWTGRVDNGQIRINEKKNTGN
jgi:hypothetical protein